MAIPAFQGREHTPRAFGVAFQDFTRRPYMYTTISREAIHIEVQTAMQTSAPGTGVYIQIHIKDANQTTEQLFNPDTSITITIYNPSGVAVVTDGAMTNESLGTYGYNYQTTTGSPVGLYTAKFKAVNGSVTGLTHPIGVFLLRAE